MNASLPLPIDRDELGRFVAGNNAGESTRFTPGKTGNPLGRPPSCDTWLKVFEERGYGPAELRRILTDPRSRPTERKAAKWALAYLLRHEPIVGADPVRSRRYYRRWYRKTFNTLFAIFENEKETPERRDAARKRLCNWWDE